MSAQKTTKEKDKELHATITTRIEDVFTTQKVQSPSPKKMKGYRHTRKAIDRTEIGKGGKLSQVPNKSHLDHVGKITETLKTTMGIEEDRSTVLMRTT